MGDHNFESENDKKAKALLKKSSTHHEFGKILPNLAIKKNLKIKSSGEC
jgi:hypothetical protein